MWDSLIINPMLNLLLTLYGWVGNNFILAIAIFTVFFRLIMLPFTLRQQRSSMKMQEMQPQVQELQKKYKDDPVKMQEEFKKIGYNPAEQIMGCLPMLLQFPIWIGLYRAIIMMVADSPQLLYELTQRAYSGVDLNALLPINNNFLWMNLAQPDPIYVLPVLVAATMFVSQKLMMPAKQPNAEDNPIASATQSMTYTMPLMFGFFSLSFASGLSVYFIISNIISVFQGFLIRREREQAKADLALEKKSKKQTKVIDDETDEFDEAVKASNKKYKESVKKSADSANGASNKPKDYKVKGKKPPSKRKQKGRR